MMNFIFFYMKYQNREKRKNRNIRGKSEWSREINRVVGFQEQIKAAVKI